MRTRNIIPKVKQRRTSKYESLVGSTIGSREILQSLPRSLFEVECLTCGHRSVQRGVDLEKLEYRECQSCKIEKRDPNLNNRYLRTQGNAKFRNLEFSISKAVFKEIASKDCFYCESAPQQDTKDFVDRCPAYNGLDRIDPNMGYVQGNIVSCCKYCNYAKHDMSIKEFKNWLDRCYENSGNWSRLG